MAPAEPQAERNDLKMVSPDSLLMKVPQVTREEWEAASKTYFNEAQQIALHLRVPSSPAEGLIEEADAEAQAGNFRLAKTMLVDAIGQLQKGDSPDSWYGWVRAIVVAERVSDQELSGSIVHQGGVQLRHLGLETAAQMLETCPRIAEEFGPAASRAFCLGLMYSANSLINDDSGEASLPQLIVRVTSPNQKTR